MLITLGVEDELSELVAKRLVAEYAPGMRIIDTIGLQGNRQLRQQLRRLNQIAAHRHPALVLTDLDRPQSCPPELLREWTQSRVMAPNLLLRVAVLEIESWLLADRSGIARWLSLAVSQVPSNPESIFDPKRALVELAGRSRNRALREAIVPRRGAGTHHTGPGYNESVGEYVTNHWNTEAARSNAPSLDRAIIRIGELEHNRAN